MAGLALGLLAWSCSLGSSLAWSVWSGSLYLSSLPDGGYTIFSSIFSLLFPVSCCFSRGVGTHLYTLSESGDELKLASACQACLVTYSFQS